jgi:hypothetical protein
MQGCKRRQISRCMCLDCVGQYAFIGTDACQASERVLETSNRATSRTVVRRESLGKGSQRKQTRMKPNVTYPAIPSKHWNPTSRPVRLRTDEIAGRWLLRKSLPKSLDAQHWHGMEAKNRPGSHFLRPELSLGMCRCTRTRH